MTDHRLARKIYYRPSVLVAHICTLMYACKITKSVDQESCHVFSVTSSFKFNLLMSGILGLLVSLGFQFWSWLLVEFKPTILHKMSGPPNLCGNGVPGSQVNRCHKSLRWSYRKLIARLMTGAFSKLHYQNNSAKDVHYFGVFLFAFVLCLRIMEYVL